MSLITEQMTTEAWAEQLLGQYLLFGLLGKLLYSHPDSALLKPVIEGDLFGEAPFASDSPEVVEGLSLLQQWREQYQQPTLHKEVLTEVQVDYMRLFAITERLPLAPWESFYGNDERLLFQECMLDVRNWYARFGLELINVHREPDDHIGLELLFVAHLAQLGLKAVEDNNAFNLEQVLAAQRGFLTNHLLTWAPQWCDQMVHHARTDYYRGLALVARGALLALSRLLQLETAAAEAVRS
ncbi:MAG: molecular chaperone TorD family protein [Anaerolineaceae bacterium]|nr:molecular chaperone TorD family protein [Anaerolineaceae bacterium]